MVTSIRGSHASANVEPSLVRAVVCSMIGALLVGIPFGVGRCFSFNGNAGGSLVISPRLFVSIALFVLVSFVLFFVFFRFQPRVSSSARRWRESHPAVATCLKSSWMPLVLFVLILLIWVPAFLALYPGYYASDGCIQVSNYLVDGFVDQHQPIFHTLILVGLINAGDALFGSANAGLTLYCVAQAIVVAASMAFACKKGIEWGGSAVICIGVTLLVAVNPVVQAWTFATTKDILFGAALLLSLVFLVDWVLQVRHNETVGVSTIVGAVCSLVLMCLFRKQGIYVIVVLALVALVVYRKRWKYVLVTFVLPIVVAWAALQLLAFGTGAVSDSSREMLSVPSQQIARVYVMQKDELTADQIGQIEKYYDLDGLSGYIALNADPAKGSLKEDALSGGMAGYVALWAELGMEFPATYLNAILNTTIGYFYPTSQIANRWAGLAPWNEFSLANSPDSDDQIVQNSLLPSYYETLQTLNYNFGAGFPLLTLWMSPCIPYLVLVFALMMMLYRRRYERIIPLLLPGLFWCSLLLGPVLNTRYSYPLLLCVPVILVFALMVERKKRPGKHGRR